MTNWKEKIRQDYAGILSPEIIEQTIEYWLPLIEQARKEGAREVIEAIPDKRVREPYPFRKLKQQLISKHLTPTGNSDQ